MKLILNKVEQTYQVVKFQRFHCGFCSVYLPESRSVCLPVLWFSHRAAWSGVQPAEPKCRPPWTSPVSPAVSPQNPPAPDRVPAGHHPGHHALPRPVCFCMSEGIQISDSALHLYYRCSHPWLLAHRKLPPLLRSIGRSKDLAAFPRNTICQNYSYRSPGFPEFSTSRHSAAEVTLCPSGIGNGRRPWHSS